MSARIIYIYFFIYFLEALLTSSDMFVLHFQTLVCHFSYSLLLFYFSVLFWQVYRKIACHPVFFVCFFYYHGGFMSVRRRFGDERDGIILIPALPLSRSNSLTKLSDSILTPTARVNLLCHLQSTRGSTKSFPYPYQNPLTAPLFRTIKVYFLNFFLFL